METTITRNVVPSEPPITGRGDGRADMPAPALTIDELRELNRRITEPQPNALSTQELLERLTAMGR